MGYKTGNVYQINIEKSNYVYNIEAINSPETKMTQYSSEISIRQEWEIIQEYHL